MRAAATTAVVAGTATAVSGRVSRRQQARAQQASGAETYEQQPVAQQPAPPPVAPAPAAGISDASIDQLTKLAKLHEQGVLTDEEFGAEKAKLLGL
jgi:hypothetical protein